MSEPNSIELRVDDVVDERYRICRRIGRGGMGTVYEALQINLARQVALKVLRPELAGDELATKRFEREARAASSIDHRNVVHILDFGHLPTGELYYTMELLHGRDLSQVLRDEGALPWSRVGWIILQVVRAFAAIHDKGIVHRDIKPANCFLVDPKPGDDPDFVKILDFGIANLHDRSQASALTAASDIIGSVHYMAPEQAAANHVDARTDIYSLGIMMYELLTGQLPFRETNAFRVMLQHQQEPPRPPREVVPTIPPEVEAIILRAVAKAPAQRFQSMAELEAELLPLVELPAGSGARPLPSASGSAERRAAGSGAGRSLLGTHSGPTGTEVVTGGADTRPGVEGSLELVAAPIGEPSPRRPMWPIALVVLVFLVALGLTVWLERAKQADEVASFDEVPREAEASERADAAPVRDEDVVDEALRPLPPPEAPYDPFADPFGAPPLQGRTAPRPRAAGSVAAGLAERPSGKVLLEEILPPESWMLAPGSIAGRIVDDEERPLTKAQVCAWIVDPSAPFELRRRPRCGSVDRHGRFELREVPPSLYDVSAFARGMLPQSLLVRDGHPLVVQPGERSEAGDVVLAPGGVEVRGVVKTTTGAPLALASVSLVGSARALAVTNAAGDFSLWAAAESGEVTVVAWSNGYTDVIARGRAGDRLELVLQRESVLLGKVVEPESGRPVARAKVRAGGSGGLDPLVYTDTDGHFRISALPEGSYQPTARTALAYGQAKKAVTLEEGKLSPEVVIEAYPLAAAPPPAAASTTGAGSDAAVSRDATTGDAETETGDGGDAPAVAGREESPKPMPAVTDKTLRRDAARRLARCGKDGAIELTADFVLDTGKLLNPSVRVTGRAVEDPRVAACAEREARRIRLLPRKEPTSFETLVVKL